MFKSQVLLMEGITDGTWIVGSLIDVGELTTTSAVRSLLTQPANRPRHAPATMPLSPMQPAATTKTRQTSHAESPSESHSQHHLLSVPLWTTLLYHTIPTQLRLLTIVASNHCPLTTPWTARNDSPDTTITIRLRLHTIHAPHSLDHGLLP